MEIDVVQLCALARQAGAAIMDVYQRDHQVEIKADASPLTVADRLSHEVIVAGLKTLTPDIPVLSEEGRDIPYTERQSWETFWLVDPLDGTKEFIKRNGEFTVNLALIEKTRPILGIIFVPAQNDCYFGIKGRGAWRQHGDEPVVSINVSKPDKKSGLTVVASRSHPSPELEDYLIKQPVKRTISVGSSLKFCAVAEGRADLYPRFGPTMEWDTAAGQAIVEAAGGHVRTMEGRSLVYNKSSLLNPHFIVGAG